jgi:hypothetical protein
MILWWNRRYDFLMFWYRFKDVIFFIMTYIVRRSMVETRRGNYWYFVVLLGIMLVDGRIMVDWIYENELIYGGSDNNRT